MPVQRQTYPAFWLDENRRSFPDFWTNENQMYISQSYRGSECALGHLRSLGGHSLPRYKCIIEFHYARYILAYRSNLFFCLPPTQYFKITPTQTTGKSVASMKSYWSNAIFVRKHIFPCPLWLISVSHWLWVIQFPVWPEVLPVLKKRVPGRICVLTQSHIKFIIHLKNHRVVTYQWPFKSDSTNQIA